MKRKIIEIDESKCNGCGKCVSACHEGAIGLVNGKAKLLRDDYCDGLGDCLPECPAGAISFTEREAAAYSAEAVAEAKAKKDENCGSPSFSALENWPVQIKLAPMAAPYFAGSDILIAADCTAYACGDFHERFMRGRTVLVGCPKLDSVDYSEKLGEIFTRNEINSITLTRMEVPCCGGMEYAVRRAAEASGKSIPITVVTLSVSGEIINTEKFS
ncbi:MAG: 4Fe-4S binding protein [Oscillospiraceae bacterium]|nr:4Fe-4S binding protein [Oscillospiraceae bacterium]